MRASVVLSAVWRVTEFLPAKSPSSFGSFASTTSRTLKAVEDRRIYAARAFSSARHLKDNLKTDSTAKDDAQTVSSKSKSASFQEQSTVRSPPTVFEQALSRASTFGQYVNAYTGTDYTAIEALRQDISKQETVVKTFHEAVIDHKSRYDQARDRQASTQRETLALSERKSSWSPSDLGRYTTLIHSQYEVDQMEQKEKENLLIAERDLEAARSSLEKLQMRQYHEEQIRSDNIRRNGMWVTSATLLATVLGHLAGIFIFLPWQRRRTVHETVKEITAALDARQPLVPTIENVELAIDGIVEPGASLEELEKFEHSPELEGVEDDSVLEVGEVVLRHLQPLKPLPRPALPKPWLQEQLDHAKKQLIAIGMRLGESLHYIGVTTADLFSNRQISIRMIEMTGSVFSGFGIGVIASFGLMRLLR